MFFPIGDTPNPRGFIPFVNWALIAANVVIYLFISLPLSMSAVDPSTPGIAEYIEHIRPHLPPFASVQELFASLSAYDVFVFAHGYKPAAPDLTDLFASMFLHGGLLHLAGNMLFLWIYGDNVEHRLGRTLYLLTYLSCGVGATLFFALFAGESMIPLVGASGAISGVLGLYFLLFPRNKVKVFVFLFPLILDVFLIPARWVLGAYVLIDNLLPFMLAAESGVAYGAHLGGFIVGLVVAWTGERCCWSLKRSFNKDSVPAGSNGPAVGPAPRDPAERLRFALRDGDPAAIMKAYADINAGDIAGMDPHDVATFSSWLVRSGYGVSASRLLRRYLAANARRSDLAPIYLELGLADMDRGQIAPAYQHLLSVFDYSPDPMTASKARAALERIEASRPRRR